ncbi:nuclear transport factor 2 family protein [Burkholderia sp. BCC1972]|uniref:nuclear transport factor 2 family protein n=1 Tax=Burkholderia sp. BCC1972 TaxID=2817438 RepID=UPI002ABE87DC|nr:nuclear transport factor 2 family protein [Burkholderia sp. BCC1972]
MRSQDNLRLTHLFLEKMSSGASAEEIAALCTPDLDWNIPGDAGVLPWVGRRRGRDALADFIRDTQTMIERISLDVEDVLAGDNRAVILGHLTTRVNATGKLIDSAFAIVLTFSGEKIASFLLLEDSFAVSVAARH